MKKCLLKPSKTSPLREGFTTENQASALTEQSVKSVLTESSLIELGGGGGGWGEFGKEF